jgi:hypothetical protein
VLGNGKAFDLNKVVEGLFLFSSDWTRKMRGSWTHEDASNAFAKSGNGRTSRRLTSVVALVLLIATPALNSAASATEVVTALALDPAQLELGRHEGYDLVSIDGAVHMTEPGKPMLPVFNIQLLVPPGSVCSDVTASPSGTVVIPGHYDILPAPRPVRFSSIPETDTSQPEAQFHKSNSPYPTDIARLAGGGSIGAYTVATVQVSPLQYLPATGELILHTNIEVSVATETSGDGARSAASAPRIAATEAVARLVENPEDVALYSPAARGAGDRTGTCDYLIVTPSHLADEFARLADWKTLKGVRAEIITLESIEANPLYAGVDEAERIRECIRYHHLTRGTSWVLLGGDTSVLPSREAYDFFFDQGLPCDLYFSDLDGDWNADGDDRWGEIDEDGVDLYADVFVGRAPVGDGVEAATFVNKVLEYEGAPFDVWDDFQLKMLFLGEIMWDDPDPYTDGALVLDMIEGESVPSRFFPVTKLYESSGNLWASTAVGELNDGYGIVVHEGHANIAKASVGPDDLTNAHLDALGNGLRGGLWYSVGCWSAAIDHDTFGEHWLTNSLGGGVAYVGNSRYGWGCPGYPGECVSDLYSREFFTSLFTDGFYRAGAVHADAKHEYAGLAVTDDYMRYAMYELNLLGDPEMPIWTDTPRAMTVTHADAVAVSGGVATLEVGVSSGGSPVEGATVCVASADGLIYELAQTSASGSATLLLDTDGGMDVTVTVTARNCLPSGSVAFVGESSTGVPDGDPAAVTSLGQNYPNPCNPATSVRFSLADDARVTIDVYDVTGRRVIRLVDRKMKAGTTSVRWNGRDANGSDVASGTYFVRMSAGSKLFERKMTLLR